MRPLLPSLLLCLLGAIPATADARAHPCRIPRDAESVARSGRLEVFRRDAEETRGRPARTTLWTCRRASGRTDVAFVITYSFIDRVELDPPVLRGHFAAFTMTQANHYGQGVVTTSVLDARHPTKLPPTTLLTSFGDPPVDSAEVEQLALSADGTPVTLLRRSLVRPGSYETVEELRDGDRVAVDSGAPGTITGVAIDAGVITWRHAGEPRSEPLHDPARQPAPAG